MTKHDTILSWLDDNTSIYTEIADRIWEYAEPAWREDQSADIQKRHLKEMGFTIVDEIGGIKTAFSAERGTGKPIIGFLGEYDALPGLSQKVIPTKEAVTEGAPGHGCGHNLLGTGCLAAAVSVSQWLEENGTGGTIRYYGCPAEEEISGKTFMARSGCFDDLDAAFNYHPGSLNMPGKGSAVGVYNLNFNFTGTTAHAGGAPHRGRSALDAVELMNVGVNYLREHVPEKVRMHYAITDGGRVPNIVPETAAVWYFLRAPDRKLLDEVFARVRKVADGAALMTETSVEVKLVGACSSLLNNHYLADLHYQVMKDLGPIEYDDQEIAFANEINANYPEENRKGVFKNLRIPESETAHVAAAEKQPVIGENFPAMDAEHIMTGSTDVGDVSWITPLSMLGTACHPSGASAHSWGVTAASGMSIGHKGMMHAAKIMACAAALVISDPAHLKKAQEEFESQTADAPYINPLPPEVDVKDAMPR
jgi:aminobenzoyl-glutamate utilization protein B